MTKWERVNVLLCTVGRAEVRLCCGPCDSAKFLVRVENKRTVYAQDTLSLIETLRLAENLAAKYEPAEALSND